MQVRATTGRDVHLDRHGRHGEPRPVFRSTIAYGRGAILTMAALAPLLSGCSKAATDRTMSPSEGSYHDPSPSAAPLDSPDTATPRMRGPSALGPDGGPTADITAPCVLHAGDIHIHRREIMKPNGKPGEMTGTASCSLNAECVWVQGQPSPGDGDVEVECTDRRCTCRRTLLSSRARPSAFAFESDVPCSTTEQAERLLIEHCMKGLKVAGAKNRGSGNVRKQ